MSATDPDPLAGATIVVHPPPAAPGAPAAGSVTPGAPPAGLTPDWHRLRLYGGGALLLLCFALFGWQVWRGREPAQVTAQPLGQPARGAEIKVHIAGAVAQPGVYRLAQGDRLEDAINAAGGLTPDADGDRLNLAQRVRDEQRIDVPFARPKEQEPSAATAGEHAPPAAVQEQSAIAAPMAAPAGNVVSLPTPAPAATPARSGVSSPGTTTGKVNVNTATQAQLERLPGIGEVSARRILAYRAANGPLRSLDDLRRAGLSESIVRRAAEFLVFE